MHSPAYDANGNTLTDPSGKSYSWDFENRLTQAINPGVGTTTFRYDPFGRRIQKSGPLGTTNYLYDGFNDVEEVDNGATILAKYAQARGVDEPLSEIRAGTASYYQSDALESVTSLSNSTGTMSETYTYDSFGKLTLSTGTLTNPFEFTGREFDSETGTYYYRARYYDANVGRFISADPSGFKGGVNSYDYVRNSPTDLVDSTGLDAEVICEPVQQYHLGFWVGARHCRLRVNCGHQVPDRTYELNGRSASQPLTVEKFDPSRPGYRVPLTKPPCGAGRSYCDFEECLVNQFNFYYDSPSNLPHYDPIHNNSNDFIAGLAFACGGSVQYPTIRVTINPYYWFNYYGGTPW